MGFFLFKRCYSPQITIICPGTYIEGVCPSSDTVVVGHETSFWSEEPNYPTVVRLSRIFPLNRVRTNPSIGGELSSSNNGALAVLSGLAPRIQILIGSFDGHCYPFPTRRQTL